MPAVMEQMTSNAAIVGLPATMLIVGRALAAYPLGWMMDTYGRRTGLALGYGVGAFASVLAVWAVLQGNPWLFVGMALLLGASRAAGEQSRYVAAEVSAPSNRAKAIGLVVTAGSFGAIGGPLLITPSAQWAASQGLNQFAGPWIVSLVLAVLAVVLVWASLRPDPIEVMGDALRAGRVKEGRPLREVFAGSGVRLAVAALMAGQVVMTMLMVITPLHMLHHGFGLDGVAWVIMAHTLGMYGPASFSGWLVDKIGAIRALLLGSSLLIASAVVAPLVHDLPGQVASLFLLGLAWNICFVGGSALFASALGATGRGRAQGVSEAAVAFASGAGSLSTGAIYSFGGLELVALVGLTIAIAITAAMVWAASRPDLAPASAGA
jgi:MFS family permease